MKHRTLKITLIITAALLLLCCAAVGIYAADYYHMDEQAVAAMAASDTVAVTNESGLAIFAPESPNLGFIFYPGGKVEYTAYAPLMQLLAENGVLCIIPHMPLNLAVMGVDTADRISDNHPEIDTWYIGGHSLGGSMAASHASHCDKVKGLVLLAAYSTADLSSAPLQALSIYGTEDRVLNMEKYAEYRPNLPADTTERIINGGNHAQFGCYGAQDGDGSPLISELEQRLETASAILEFMGLAEPAVPDFEEETYTFWMEQPNHSALRSMLTLRPEEGTYFLSEPVFSSRLNTGSYTIENGILTCYYGDETVYCFDVTDSGMVYRAADSAPLYAHGSVFAENPNEEKPVPDGGVFAALMVCS